MALVIVQKNDVDFDGFSILNANFGGDLDFTGTGTITGLTSSDVGLGNVTNESKETMFTNPVFTGSTSVTNIASLGGSFFFRDVGDTVTHGIVSSNATYAIRLGSGGDNSLFTMEQDGDIDIKGNFRIQGTGSKIGEVKFFFDSTEYWSINTDDEVFAITDVAGVTDVLIIDNTTSTIGFGWDIEMNSNQITNVSTIEVNTVNNSGGNLTLSTFGSPRLVLGGASNTSFQNVSDVTINSNSGATDYSFRLVQSGTDGGTSNVYVGTIDPNGTVVADAGSVFIREDGTNSTIYIKEGSGTSAGWIDLKPSGGGGGDLLSTNNLSDVADATTSFNNIKQSASTTFQGVVEIATQTEVNTGTDSTRPVTPSTLANSTLASNVATNNAKVGVTTQISNLVEDLTPELGGDLDVLTRSIVSSAGNNITLNSNNDIDLISAQAVSVTSVTDIDIDSGADVIISLGDAVGANKISITDSADSQVVSINSDGTISTLGNFELDGNGTRRTLFEEFQDGVNLSALRISQRTGGGISQGTLDVILNGTSNFVEFATDRTSGYLFDKNLLITTGVITSSSDLTLRRGGGTTIATLTTNGIETASGFGIISDQEVEAGTYVEAGTLFKSPIYTVATVPSAIGNEGGFIYVQDGASGSPTIAWSDGTDWLTFDATTTPIST